MKKIHRLAVTVLSLSLVFCSCFQTEFSVGSASAEETELSLPSQTENQEYDGPYEAKLEGGFSWKFDPDTQTATLRGSGIFPYSISLSDYNPKTIVIGPEITGLENYQDNSPTLSYEVDPENPYLASYDGCLYTKDYKKLLRCPTEKKSIDFHPNLEILGKWSLWDCPVTNASITLYGQQEPILVIPWGVTTMEERVFGRYNLYTVFLPDTLINIDRDSNVSSFMVMYCSPFLRQLLEEKYRDDFSYGDFGYTDYIEEEAHGCIPIKKFYEQYGIQPNSLKILDGKAYYFDENYNHPVGWKQVNGNWYYFNDYGAAVVKIWLKSGGKWYFMQADGTMAKSRWIKWYNKWYYVDASGAMYANRWIKSSGKWYYLGTDGAMYTSRYTPDGYWVNANGVWV